MRETVDFIPSPSYVSYAQSLDAVCFDLSNWLEDRGLDGDAIVWSRVYLSDPANQVEGLREHILYKEILSKGAFSYVGQPLLNGARVGVLFSVDLDKSLKKSGTPQQMMIKSASSTMLFHTVRLTDAEAYGLSAKEQTEEIFNRHIAWLKENGMTLRDNCVRTWLYVRDIDHNYGEVMVGRNSVFAREGLTPDTHFIASTGIGGNTEYTKAVVAIDFLSVKQPRINMKYLQALDYLNPTHEYGVSFERGVNLKIAGQEKTFISGTASIDKEGQCIFVGDVAKQTSRLFENISQLLADARKTLDDVKYFVVYLRDICDARILDEYMANHFPNVPYLVSEASVCRPQWLVEVECVANNKS